MIYQVEKWVKEKAFKCQTCGQCMLSNTSMTCPMNCPKGLRNGPCGGTLDGKCEVLPDKNCVWMNIEEKSEGIRQGIHMPLDKNLLNTSSYLNLLMRKDRETRVPKDFVKSGLASTSSLAQKLCSGEFVVTAEIHSPKTQAGLKRVHRSMQHIHEYVDAVNTTTNAGGRPSLHSTETAKVVAEYGVEAIIQFCGRDHDAEDFKAQFHSALEMGYANFLLLTGDWLPGRERGIDQQNWFPMDSSQMTHIVNSSLKEYRDIYGVVPLIGGASNPFSTPMQISADRWNFKQRAGARFTQTQVITDVDIFSDWFGLCSQNATPNNHIIASLPLVGSARHYEILKSLPGVYIAPEFDHLIKSADDLALVSHNWVTEVVEQLKMLGVSGVHLMNFGMEDDQVVDILEGIRESERLLAGSVG